MLGRKLSPAYTNTPNESDEASDASLDFAHFSDSDASHGRSKSHKSSRNDSQEATSDSDDDAGSEDSWDRDGEAIERSDVDDDEQELERLVLGTTKSYRKALFAKAPEDGLLDSSATASAQTVTLASAQIASKPDDQSDDDDFFQLSTEGSGAVTLATDSTPGSALTTTAEPAWMDSDDDRLSVSLASASHLRKLRKAHGEDAVDGAEYARRLRQQFLTLHPTPKWVRDAERRASGAHRSSLKKKQSKKNKKRHERNNDDGTYADSSSDDSDSSFSSQGEDGFQTKPLEEFLRNASLASTRDNATTPRGLRRLRPETLDIQRSRDLPDTHKAPVGSLSFHPSLPILLSSSASSVLFLHRLDATAHPTPHPRLLSVQAQNVNIQRSEFQHPGKKVVFAGRRRYFHIWNMETGQIQKVSRILGHRNEHKTYERFRVSPCGRFLGLMGADRQGGGMVSILDMNTANWITSARLDSQNGLVDFQWWRSGDGLTILGQSGTVGEYDVHRRKFVGVWQDDGCVQATTLALGGRGGPSSLGGDKWVAVGQHMGIANIYDRSSLVIGEDPSTKTEKGVDSDSEDDAVDIQARPKPARILEQLVTGITTLVFSPDGQLLVFASRHKDNALRIAHLPSCTVYRNWPTPQTPLGRVSAVAFSAQSDVLVIGNEQGTVRLWEIRG